MIEREESNFQKIYEKYYSSLFTYAISVTKDYELAEEIVQDTFLIAWNKYEDLIFSPNPGGWLMNVTKFNIRNTLRKVTSSDPPPLPLDDAICMVGRNQHQDYLDNATEIINIITRHVSGDDLILIQKVYLEGYSCPEVAIILGIKPSTCQKRLQRLLKKLSKSKDIRIYFEFDI